MLLKNIKILHMDKDHNNQLPKDVNKDGFSDVKIPKQSGI